MHIVTHTLDRSQLSAPVAQHSVGAASHCLRSALRTVSLHTLWFCGGLLVGSPLPAAAQVYQWTSSTGSIVISDSRTAFGANVPHAVARQNVKPLSSSTQERATRETRVPFQILYQLIQVSAQINSTITAPFFVDSGATDVIIPLALAEQLGFCAKCPHERTWVEGITGRVELPTMWIDRLSVGSIHISRVKVLVSEHIQAGLLGASFLNRFAYTVDLDARELRLRARP
jgi:clan AA aspartic protease (TIGR02281 family)